MIVDEGDASDEVTEVNVFRVVRNAAGTRALLV